MRLSRIVTGFALHKFFAFTLRHSGKRLLSASYLRMFKSASRL